MKARKLLVALLTPVLALTVASCGGKGDSTTSSSQAPATSSNANPASSTTSITNNVETITISAALASTAGTKVTVDARVLAVTTQHLLLGDSTGKIVVFLGNRSGNTNKVGDHLQVTGALEDRNGINQFGTTATIKTLTTAAPEVSETVVEWTATEVDAFVDKQTYGAYITVSGSLAISGNYYNLTVEGASKGVVSLAYLNSSLRSKVSSGKSYKITGYAVYLSGGKFVNVFTTAVEEITSGGDTGGDTGGNVSTSSSSSEVISSSTSISSSSEDLSSSTGENLLDYITGTPETRREAYMATEDMYMNTFWGVFEKIESYGYSYNLYFMDGSIGYRVKNVKDPNVVSSLEIGKVYEVTGDVDTSVSSNPSTSGKENDVIFRLVENGESKIQSKPINLGNTSVTNSDQFSLTYFDTGVIKTASDKPTVTVNNVDYILTSSGGTTEESSVLSLLSSLTVGQNVKLKQGVLDKDGKIKVISVTDIEVVE